MQLVYNIVIYLLKATIYIGSFFDAKLKMGVRGRREAFDKLRQSISKTDKVFWFHCASLGEYEQGLPVFERLKKQQPDYKVVLSFFSPSGYEIRKNAPIADVVVYLPIDTPKNAKAFLKLVHPDLIVFVKYEIWINYLKVIKKRGKRAILISALFREHQVFFKWYGSLFKKALNAFEHIFVQNVTSELLLKRINYQTVTIAGDTRFDRVIQNQTATRPIDNIAAFVENSLCLVIGSSWPEDEVLWTNFINKNDFPNLKYILVPHNVEASHVTKLKATLKIAPILYSESENVNLESSNVLIVDTIGLLSSIYSYAQIAYVGGAMGSTGLHNILEPAVYGIPIVIGKNIEKFPEAQAMIKNGGLLSIKDYKTFETIITQLINNSTYREELGAKNKHFIQLNQGAVNQIMDLVRI